MANRSYRYAVLCSGVSPSNARDCLPRLLLLRKKFVSILGISLPPHWMPSFLLFQALASHQSSSLPLTITPLHHFSQHRLWNHLHLHHARLPPRPRNWGQDLGIHILNLLIRYSLCTRMAGPHYSKTDLGALYSNDFSCRTIPIPAHQFLLWAQCTDTREVSFIPPCDAC